MAEARRRSAALIRRMHREAGVLMGNIVNSPCAKGLSGCGIWRVHSPTISGKDWHPSQTKLIGIAHTWHGKPLEVIRGTVPNVHLGLIGI
jgi:hypothetical protein